MADGSARIGRSRLGLVAVAVFGVVALVVGAAAIVRRAAPPAALPAGSSIAFIHGNDVVVVSGSPARQTTLITEQTSGDESCCTLAWSPDGRRLLVGANEHLSTVNADGTGHVEIVDEQVISGIPGWSPDGTAIAVAFEIDGSPRIFLVKPDGTGQRNLTPDRDAIGDVGSYAWSPDGRSIAFGAAPPTDATGTGSSLDLVPAAGGPVRTLATAGAGLGVTEWSSPAWAPDGTVIAYDQSAASPLDIRLEVVSAASRDASGRQVSPSGQDAYAPAWSPDGSRIAFTVWRGGTGPADLYVMNADGSNVVKVADDVGPNDHPWSPDGIWIAFGRSEGRVGQDGLFMVDAGGGDPIRLADQSVTGAIAWRAGS